MQIPKDEEIKKLFIMKAKMESESLDPDFVMDCLELALLDRGAYKLLEIWYEAKDLGTKDIALTALKDEL